MNNSHESPLVSIIVRTKDRPKLLKRALGSIFAQTYRPIEVVVVNDGGCDLDIDEIKSILGDVSLNYIRLEQNTGRAHAGNVGIENAKGEYIGFLDDDDEFLPEHIETLQSSLSIENNYSGAYADSEIIERQYDEHGNIIQEINNGVFKSLDFSHEVMLFENFIPLISCLFIKDILKETGGFDESFEIFEDWDIILRVSVIAPLIHTKKITTKYIQWSKSHQIAFVDWHKAKDFYLMILEKNFDKFTSDIIYNYVVHKQIELQNTKTELEQFITANIGELKREIYDLKSANQAFLKEIEKISFYTEELKKEIHALQEAKIKLEAELMQKRRLIEEIYNTVGWKLLTYFRTKIKIKLFPSGSKREVFYKLMIKGASSIHNRGLKGTLKRIKEKINEKRAFKKIIRENYFVPILQDEIFHSIDKKVSVVIPTKNAGDEFKFTLQKMRNQKGIKELEMVVIDSGSSDETLNIAEKNGSKILHIKPEDFNHGSVRNIGARNSNGDYIVFMSQDVIPITDYCIYKIIRVLEKDDTVVAASVKQVPRSDSDLFSCWQLWYYYNKVLNYCGDRVVSIDKKTFTEIPSDAKRSLSQLDNVFCCFKKDVFDKFGFNPLPYAEDLDMGIRLISNGYKLAFFDSVGVIHSHNRPPSYYFKRSYIDTLSILRLLEQKPIRWNEFNIQDTQDILAQIHTLYLKVNHLVDSLNNRQFNGTANELYEFVKTSIYQNDISYIGEKSLDILMPEINDKGKNVFSGNIRVNELFLNLYLNLFQSFNEFLMSTTGVMDNRDELISAIYKLYSVIGGSSLANYWIYLEDTKIPDDSFHSITSFLKEGI